MENILVFLVIISMSALVFTYWLSVIVRPNNYLVSLALFMTMVLASIVRAAVMKTPFAMDRIIIYILLFISICFLVYQSWKREELKKTITNNKI